MLQVIVSLLYLQWIVMRVCVRAAAQSESVWTFEHDFYFGKEMICVCLSRLRLSCSLTGRLGGNLSPLWPE